MQRAGGGARRRVGRLAIAGAGATAMLAFGASAAATGAGATGTRAASVLAGHLQRHSRAGANGISLTPSRTKPYWACPQSFCEAIVDPAARRTARRWGPPSGGPLLEGSGEKGGYDPQDLQSAYRIPAAGGSTQTVALVDAYGDPTAESDLAAYRERYGLEPCTHANGCFRKVNQEGKESSYPAASKGWEGETALDLDMVAAGCPLCHIVLVEATTASVANLAESVKTAAALGATEISNSYGVAEEACGSTHCEEFNADYNQPGIVVTASAGDAGYDDHYETQKSPSFPATSPYVVSVGGTTLHKTTGGGWSAEVWNEPARELGTGSGCSPLGAKASLAVRQGMREAHRQRRRCSGGVPDARFGLQHPLRRVGRLLRNQRELAAAGEHSRARRRCDPLARRACLLPAARRVGRGRQGQQR